MDAGGRIRQWRDSLLDIIFPRCCEVCGTPLVNGEEVICTGCDMAMPRCNIHGEPFNTIHQRLMGHAPIERAAGYFYYYRNTPYTSLILSAKYRGRPRIARTLAARFAEEIAGSGFFDGIDMIIPVPLHRLRQLRRGYNQAEQMALGLGDTTGIEVVTDVLSARRHSTQTRRNAYERWLNSLHIYHVTAPEKLEGRHVLIADDVITTGATMLACCDAVHKAAPTARISVISLGVTSLT